MLGLKHIPLGPYQSIHGFTREQQGDLDPFAHVLAGEQLPSDQRPPGSTPLLRVTSSSQVFLYVVISLFR